MKLIQKILTCLLLSSLVLTGCTQAKESDAMKFKEEYESLNGTTREKDGKTIRTISISEDNPIVYADCEDIVEKINNKDTFVVYFGFSDCPWCRSIVPTLLEVADDLNISTIYYVDVKDIRDEKELEDSQITTKKEGSDGYFKLLEVLDSVLDDYTLTDESGNTVNVNEKRIYAPCIISIVEGNPITSTDGCSTLQSDGYMELSDEMLKESYSLIENVLKEIIQNDTACQVDTKC